MGRKTIFVRFRILQHKYAQIRILLAETPHPGIGHGDDARSDVFQVASDFVFELAAVDALAASPRSRRITALDHEILQARRIRNDVKAWQDEACEHLTLMILWKIVPL